MKRYITKEKLNHRIKELSSEISNRIEGPIKIIGILKGAFMFMADLVRHFDSSVEIDFLTARSYSGTISTGTLTYSTEHLPKVHNRNILLVDDIIDTGLTLSKLVDVFYAAGAKKVYTCTLLDKPARRKVDFKVDFSGFEIEDDFVIGYGMDFDEKYRNLSEIFVYEECTQEENT